VKRKTIYLFLALVLPIFIFLFLKIFGKNEFDIPIFYTKGVSSDTLATGCQFTVKGQYFVPDSVLEKWNRKSTVIIFSFSQEREPGWMKDLINEEKLEILKQGCRQCSEDFLKNCIFFLKPPYDIVLIDNQKRIRGYYKLGNLDEMDRLDVELKILLKKY
jgi:hypothetical protein